MLREVFNPQNYQWSMWSLPPLVACIYFWSLGIFIVSKNIKARINISFGILSLCSGLWLFSYAVGFSMKTYDASLFWSRNAYSGINFIAIAMYHFVVEFLDLKKQRKWVYAFYGLMLAFFPITRTKYFLGGVVKYFWGYYPYRANFIYDLFILSFCFYWFLALLNLYRAYRKETSDLKKSQIKIISVALYVVTIAFVDFVAKYKLPVYPWGYVPVAIFLSLIFYTIIRYRLMEIDTVIHRTALWLITSSMIFVPISVVVYFIRPWLASLSWLPLTFLAALLVYVYLYSYPKIQPKIDHLFRRRKYDYYQVLDGLGQKIGSELELEKVQVRIFKELKEILYIRNGILLVQQPGQEDYEEVGSLGYEGIIDPIKQVDSSLLSLPVRNKLSQYINREQKALERVQVEADPQYQEVKEEALGWLKQKEIEVLIPIVLAGKVNGLIGIGKKENLQGYTQKDIELLEKMGQQIGITIDNALHHEDIVEKGRLAEEMKLGREIQMALLPAQAPQVEGLKVTGFMIPAKEIGGDYYDYIFASEPVKEGTVASKSEKQLKDQELELLEASTGALAHSKVVTGKLAIVIGDVSGKGVAAGLIMATAKATLKGLSEQGLSPRQMLTKANSLLFEYTKGEKFMTMLYLQWHPAEGKLNYSSAGHEHILIYRNTISNDKFQMTNEGKTESNFTSNSTTGSVEVIQSGGFMLGMLPEIGEFLEDKELKLNTGDKVILYTDGVTEAHEPQGDLYSLERLVASVQRHGHKPVEELIEAVRQDVYSFISSQAQYDDITLVGMEMTERG